MHNAERPSKHPPGARRTQSDKPTDRSRVWRSRSHHQRTSINLIRKGINRIPNPDRDFYRDKGVDYRSALFRPADARGLAHGRRSPLGLDRLYRGNQRAWPPRPRDHPPAAVRCRDRLGHGAGTPFGGLTIGAQLRNPPSDPRMPWTKLCSRPSGFQDVRDCYNPETYHGSHDRHHRNGNEGLVVAVHGSVIDVI